MKKIVKYFPFLSEKNVHFIDELIESKDIDAIVEFGSGNSTKYYLSRINKKIDFISIEASPKWFYQLIDDLENDFDVEKTILRKKYWKYSDYKKFLAGSNDPFTGIIDGKSKYNTWKNTMELGPFYRFHPSSQSFLKGKLGPLFIIFRPLFKFINIFLRARPNKTIQRSYYSSIINNINFHYFLSGPSIKDQFGESPFRDEYINGGLDLVKSSNYKTILLMVDSGCRHLIVDRFIKESNTNLIVMLFDAQRPEYEKILDQYNGKFYRGSTNLLNGELFYPQKGNELDEILNKELWIFDSEES